MANFRMLSRPFSHLFAGKLSSSAVSWGHPTSNPVKIHPIDEIQIWEALFQRLEKPHLVQSAAYGEAKKLTEALHVRRLLIEQNGDPLAICQVLEKQVLGANVGSRIYRGPMFLDPKPSTETVRNVLTALRNHWRNLKGGLLLIAPALEPSTENEEILSALGFRKRGKVGWRSAIVSLDQDEQSLRKQLKSNWRNQLSSSERAGLRLNVSSSKETLEWMLKRHSEHVASKKFDFDAPSIEFLRAYHNHKQDDLLVFQAILGNEPVGGIIVIKFGQTAEYFVGWTGDAGRRSNAGNFLLWHSLVEMKKQHCRRFDVGGIHEPNGTTADGYVHFKQGMQGTEYSLIEEWRCF